VSPAQGMPTLQQRYAVATPLSDITMRRLRWLWEGRVPVAIIAMLAGRGGEGKSTFGLHLAAQLTRGTLPGEYEGTPRNVLYVAFEDDAAAVVKPRAIAAGADTAHLHMLTIKAHGSTLESSPSLITDLALIEQQVKALDAVAVIVDPLSSGMAGVNRDRSSDVRPVLDGIAEMAARTGATVLAVAHFAKGGGAAIDKLSGSHEFIDRARAVLMFATDDDGTKIAELVKSNYARSSEANIAFRLDSVPVDIDGRTVDIGAVTILGETSRSVGDVINAAQEDDAEEMHDAQRWLIAYMRDQEAYEAKAGDVLKAARSAGFRDQQIKDARRLFNKRPASSRDHERITTHQAGGGWLWSLQADAPAD